MRMLTAVLCLLARFAMGEEAAPDLAAILQAYDVREQEGDATKAHSQWLKSARGAAEAAFLAEHFDDLSTGRKYDIPKELARTGRNRTVPLLKRALADSSQAVAGIFFAAELGEMEPGFGKAIAPAVAAWIGKSVITSRDTPIEILPLLDPELAAAVFFKPEMAGVQAPHAHLVLSSCNAAGMLVPRAVLEPLLAAWEKPGQDSSAEYRVQRGYREAIIALSRHDAPEALRRAEKLIKVFPTASDDLAELPLQASGLTRLFETIADIAEDEATFAALPEAARLYFAATVFAEDCANGGFSQALSNSAGDYFPLVRKAAEVSGDTRQQKWLAWMCKPFGAAGPSPHREQRVRQMECMTPSYLEQESDLSSEWADAERARGDIVHLSTAWLLNIWVAGHPEEIKAALPKKNQ